MSAQQMKRRSGLMALLGLFAAGLLQVPGAMAQTGEPSHAHSATNQVLTINSPSAGQVNCLVHDFLTGQSFESPSQFGATAQHPIMSVQQYPNTSYAWKNWNGVFIYDWTLGGWSGSVYSIQQPIPGLPEEPTVAAPSNFAAAATATVGVYNLSWTDNSANEDFFGIWSRAKGSTAAWTETGLTAAANAQALSNVTLSETLEYCVRGTHNGLEGPIHSAPSNIVTVIVAPPPPAWPAAPSNFTATLVSGNTYNFSWTDNSPDEAYFFVQLRVIGTTTWHAVASSPANQPWLNNVAVQAGYEYAAFAFAWDPNLGSYVSSAPSNILQF